MEIAGFVLWSVFCALCFFALGKAVCQRNHTRRENEFRRMNVRAR